MAALTVDFRKHSGPTPADYMAAQIITDCGNFTLDFKNMDSVPLHSSSRLWDLDSKWNAKFTLSEKRNWDHWVIFSTAQVRRFWCLSLVQKWLGSPFPEDGLSVVTLDALTPASGPLLVNLSQVFESALLDCILKLEVIPVACAPFPTQILPSSQLCI